MTQEAFNNFKKLIIEKAESRRKLHPELRYGQSIYIESWNVFGGDRRVRAFQEADCFYKNDNVPRFWKILERELVTAN